MSVYVSLCGFFSASCRSECVVNVNFIADSLILTLDTFFKAYYIPFYGELTLFFFFIGHSYKLGIFLLSRITICKQLFPKVSLFEQVLSPHTVISLTGNIFTGSNYIFLLFCYAVGQI